MSVDQEPGILRDTLSEFRTVIRWVLSGIIQALFLVVWVAMQWAVNEYIIMRFEVTGTDKIVLSVSQWLFGIATLAPIIFFLIQLVVTMAIRTFRSIRKEIEK